MDTIDAQITEYLTRYAETLTAFDARAAAQLWATPGMILDDRYAGVLDSREAMVEGLEQSYPLYRKLGLASVGYELLNQEQLSGAITMVRVRWLFYDADGNQLTDSNAHYILRQGDDGLQACVCVQTDDLEKLQAWRPSAVSTCRTRPDQRDHSAEASGPPRPRGLYRLGRRQAIVGWAGSSLSTTTCARDRGRIWSTYRRSPGMYFVR
ncbi:hypothetical protein HDA39_003474 [Kribbella italica]|uniref:SnoaL-like domain-containing protein n=1 Tax=Kribbella italica TaxID=1540520 RepID=A0A7W9J7U4_9ACTN|nr:hypothetical protein [Kribbella italica]